VLGITLALLGMERFLGLGIFDPKLGGDPVLFQHFFWFYSHPAVYIMILPAMGVMSELITTFSHKHIFGYKFIAFSSIAIALLGFLVWGHHMFTSGQSLLASMIFSVLTFSVSIPSAIKVFNWLASMYKGSISLATPMCYALMFIFLFGIGGTDGLVPRFAGHRYASAQHLFPRLPFPLCDVRRHGRRVPRRMHYWWPKMTGRMFNDNWGRVSAMLVFIGFNLTFFPQFLMGTHGMTRRIFDYSQIAARIPEIATYNLISSLGSYVLALGLCIIPIYLMCR